METLYVPTREAWRTWLSKNHSAVSEGIWLVWLCLVTPGTSGFFPNPMYQTP
jgi:hypothetical protein